MRIYIITMPNRIENAKKLKREFEKDKANLAIIYDAIKISDVELEKLSNLKRLDFCNFVKLSRGEISLIATNIAILKDFVDSGEEACMIVEDDTVIKYPFNDGDVDRLYTEVHDKYPNVLQINFSRSNKNYVVETGTKVSIANQEFEIGYITKCNLGAQSIIWTRKSAIMFLEHEEIHFRAPWDWMTIWLSLEYGSHYRYIGPKLFPHLSAKEEDSEIITMIKNDGAKGRYIRYSNEKYINKRAEEIHEAVSECYKYDKMLSNNKRIVFLAPYMSYMFADHTKITGGIEGVLLQQIKVLEKYGHELHVLYVGKLDPWYMENTSIRFHKVNDYIKQDSDLGRGYASSVKREFYRYIDGIKPDIVFSHMHSGGAAAKISKTYRTIHQLHTSYESPFMVNGVISTSKQILENGSVVYTTNTTAEKIKKSAVSMGLDVDVSDIANAFVDIIMPYEDKLFHIEPQPVSGLPVMAGRYEQNYTGKNIHKFVESEINIDAFVVGEHSKYIPFMRESEFCNLHLNAKHSDIMNIMVKSPCVLIGCVEETASLVAIEAMILGVTPIIFKNTKSDVHATSAIYERISGNKAIEICYDDPAWKEKTKAAIIMFTNKDLEYRLKLADKARAIYSNNSWYEEFINICELAKLDTVTKPITF